MRGPHFNSVLNWVDRSLSLEQIHGSAALVARHHLKGNRKSSIDNIGEVAIERGLGRWLKPNMTADLAYAKVVTTIKAYKRKYRRVLPKEQLDQIRIPSLRTFQRRCEQFDKYTRDYYRKGPYYANKVHRIYRQ